METGVRLTASGDRTTVTLCGNVTTAWERHHLVGDRNLLVADEAAISPASLIGVPARQLGAVDRIGGGGSPSATTDRPGRER